MPQDCIEYSQYKKILQQQTTSSRRNIFEQNRLLSQQLQKVSHDNLEIQAKLNHYRSLCASMIDAIGRVFSEDLARQLRQMVEGVQQSEGLAVQMSNTIFEALATHQLNNTSSNWSQSRKKQPKTPEKQLEQHFIAISQRQRVPNINFSPEIKRNIRQSSRSPYSCRNNQISTNRSSHISNMNLNIAATAITCELCDQNFGPNQFIEHAFRCKQVLNMALQSNMNTQSEIQDTINLKGNPLQDTQDRKLKKQSNDYLSMMKNLMKIQSQIQQQIHLLKFSKEKIDRDTEKRKLQKDLAKVMLVIQQKKRQGKQNQKRPQGKAVKVKKNVSLKMRNL